MAEKALEQQTVQQSTENRLLGAIAHASIIGQGIGILVGVFVYLNQREKSRYVAFQALQAAIYQLFALAVIVGAWILWTILYSLSFVWLIPIMEAAPANAPPPPFFWISMGSMLIPFVIMFVLWLWGFIAALQTWRGKEYRYPVIGPALERSGLWKDQ